MAYRRSRRGTAVRRRRRRNHLNPVKRYITTKRTMKWGRMAKDIMYLKRMMNSEVKQNDTNVFSSGEYLLLSATAAPQLTPGNAASPPNQGYFYFKFDYPAGGTGITQRVGQSIKLHTLQVKGRLTRQENSAVYAGTFKLFLIVDRQAQEGEELDPVPWIWDTDADGRYSLMSRIDRYKQKRFKIISAKKIKISNANISAHFNLYKKVSDKIRFTDATSAGFIDKAFYFVGLADTDINTAGTSDIINTAATQFEMRLTYVDN